MCTVTLIPRFDRHGARMGLRLGCNRDELRTRAPAMHPRTRRIFDRGVIMPIDPASGGTWVAVNDAGVIATLLNVNAGDYRDANHHAPHSRGRVIPALMHAADLDAALRTLDRITPADYAPFRLILVNEAGAAEIVSDGAELAVRYNTLSDQPMMWTSSGLGDDVVEAPRRELFESWFGGDHHRWPQLQDAFHGHTWADRPQLSVCMTRPDARTVSYTVVDIEPERVRLRYHDEPADAFGPAEVVALGREGASVA